MFCSNCGQKLSDSARFCSSCGTPVVLPEEPAPDYDGPDMDVTIVEPKSCPPAKTEEEPDFEIFDVKRGESADEPEPAKAQEPAGPPEPAVTVDPTVYDRPGETELPPFRPEPPASRPEPPASRPEPPAYRPEPHAYQPEAPARRPGTQSRSPEGNIGRPGRGGPGGKKIIPFVVIGAAAVGVIVLAAVLISTLAGGGKLHYAYLNDDFELMYVDSLKESAEALEVTDDIDEYTYPAVQFSDDGKYLYYIGDDGSLYRAALKELGGDERPEELVSDVREYTLLSNGGIVYVENDDGDTQLRMYDGKRDFRLTSDEPYGFVISEDEKWVYYTERDDVDGYTLYRMELNQDSRKETLLDEVDAIYSAYDAKVLVYGIYEGEDDGGQSAPSGDDGSSEYDPFDFSGFNYGSGSVEPDSEAVDGYSVYSRRPGGSDETLLAEQASGVYGLEIDGSKVSFYYIVENELSYPLYAFVEDDLVESDRAIIEALAASGASLETASYEDYDNADLVWEHSRRRDSLMREEYFVSSYDIYRCMDGTSTAVAEGVVNRHSSYADGVFLYRKADMTVEKVMKLSELYYTSDIWSAIDDDELGSVWYQNVGGAESELDIDEEGSVSGMYVLNGKEVVINYSEDGERSLLAYSIGGAALTFSATVTDEDFSSPRRGTDSSDRDRLYYFVDVENETNGPVGTLMCYENGEETVVADEISGCDYLTESGTAYAYVYGRDDTVELFLVEDGSLTEIDDKISEYSIAYVDSKHLFYISSGDLYLWNGSESFEVAGDVLYFFVSEYAASYSIYL